MDLFIRIALPLLFFTATGRLLLVFLPGTKARFSLWIDRMLLCLILGMGFYPLFSLVAQGLTGLPMNRGTPQVFNVTIGIETIFSNIILSFLSLKKRFKILSFGDNIPKPNIFASPCHCKITTPSHLS